MLISKAEHGIDRSKAAMTSGWRTPIRPIVCPPTSTSAHRLGKYATSDTHNNVITHMLTTVSVTEVLQKYNSMIGLIDWLSMVLHLHQHNIGYTADGFTGLMTQPTVSKHWRRVVSHPARPQSNMITSPCYNTTTCMLILYKKVI